MNQRPAFAFLLLLAAFVLGPTIGAAAASACSCMPPPPADEALAEAEAVFVGVVTEQLSPAPGPVVSGGDPIAVRFTVEQAFKGVEAETAQVTTARSGAACGFRFEIGGRYLVYASLDEGALRTSICSRTRQLDPGEEEDPEVLRLRSLVAATLTPAPGSAEDAVLDALVGSWSGTGNIHGMAFTQSSRFEWTLGHQFLRIVSDVWMTMPDGRPGGFSTEILYDPLGEGRYQCHYADSTGNMGPFESWMEGDLLLSQWEAHNDEPPGRQSVRHNDDGSMTVVFFSLADDGAWAEVGQLTLTRAVE